jgi:sugar phosphate isomerase/epimerase
VQKLEIYQSLWAMDFRNPNVPERGHERNFELIAEAGYDGVCVDPAVSDLEKYRATLPYYARHGLKSMVNLFPRQSGDMKPLLEFAREVNATKVNVIGQVTPVSVAGAIPLIYRWMDLAASMGFELLFETHRDSLLNDLYYTLEVIDAVPELKLTADLSHFVLEREFMLPLSRRDRAFLQRIHDRTDCFQGRVASREQIQVQLDFPQHAPWVALFKELWKEGLRSWRERNHENATCVFLCELGPPPYAITDAQRLELSDRWLEALQIRQWVRDIWSELEREDAVVAAGTHV